MAGQSAEEWSEMHESNDRQVPPPVDLALWGKSKGLDAPYPVVCHLLDAAAIAGLLWERYVSGSLRRQIARGLGVAEGHSGRLLEFWAGLHDVGKVIPGFQGINDKAAGGLVGYPQAETGDRLRHDFAAHVWLPGQLATRGYARDGLTANAPAVVAAQMLGGHHGRFHRLEVGELLRPLECVPALGRGRWDQERAALVEAVWRVAGRPEAPAELPPPVAALVCGIVILADWLASQDDFLRARLPYVPTAATQEALEDHFQGTKKIVPGLLNNAGLTPVTLRPGSFSEQFRFDPNGLQRSIAESLPQALTGPGLLVVMAPMGEGKTEAAVHAARLMGEASGAPGLFVALPTMATADQMYARLREYAIRRVDGVAPLTLLHSMAWLNPLFARGAADGIEHAGEGSFVGGDDHEGDKVVVADWLRARKRGLLASLSVGTIDQALMAVLPTRHNVLRLLGLSGKVLVVDEAHAYDAYMQGLLRRLLTWLGHLRAPVILLSATLPAQTAESLIKAYARGAGLLKQLGGISVSYPGWIYLDVEVGTVTGATVKARSYELKVTTRPVTPTADGRADRSAALERLLAPLPQSGGCALVVCTTVAEAQDTYRNLISWCGKFGDGAVELSILHARFPARQREQITQRVIAEFGKDGGQRPKAAVLVATQVVEQSLDLDFDLVISDLAPIALLLQRAGRGWRHPRPQEDRCGFSCPELAVLVPTSSGKLRLPGAWTFVYDESLLIRTHRLLADNDRLIKIPEHVQGLVDGVYDAEFAAGQDTADIGQADLKRFADEQVQQQLAKMIAIPSPANLSNLYELTDADVDEDLIATRLGADSVRVLCCYQDDAGRRWLDPRFEHRLPKEEAGAHRRFTPNEVRDLLAETIPVRSGPWVRARGPHNHPPSAWAANPWLRDLVLLPQPVSGDGVVSPAQVGDREFSLSPVLGLVTTVESRR